MLGLGVVGLAAGSMWLMQRKIHPPSSLVLALDLSSPPTELSASSLFAPVPKLSHWDMLRVIDHAAYDTKVRGIVANVGGGTTPWTMAQAQEIRQASQTHCKHLTSPPAPQSPCILSLMLSPCPRACAALQSSASLLAASSCTHSLTRSVACASPSTRLAIHCGPASWLTPATLRCVVL